MSRDDKLIANLDREFAVLARRDRAESARLGRDEHPDLKVAEYGLLVHLIDHGPHRPSELAEHIGILPSTISYQLQSLATLGLVERLPAPNDRRAYLVAATGEGHRRVVGVQALRVRRLGERLASWPERDVLALTELLAKFNDSADGPRQHCGDRAGQDPP